MKANPSAVYVSGVINQPARTQYSVHPPSHFLCSHQAKLLPGWSYPVRSMLIVLQPCDCDLLERSPAAEAQKRQRRRHFLQFGAAIAAKIKQSGYTAAIFDPRTGLPLCRPGTVRLDDVAIVQATLGYQTVYRDGCSVLIHPTWGSAIYPSTLVSSIAPAQLEQILTGIEQSAKPRVDRGSPVKLMTNRNT